MTTISLSKDEKEILSIAVGLKILIIIVGIIAFYSLPFSDFYYENNYRFAESEGGFIDLWTPWDGQWYLKIANEGYKPHSQDVYDIQSRAFLPLYPLLIWIFSLIFQSKPFTAWLVNVSASILAMIYLYRLFQLDYSNVISKKAVLYIMIFPSAIFFSSAYTEGLFLLLIVLSFTNSRTRNWRASGVFAGLSALTKVIGVLIIIPLGYEWYKGEKNREGFWLLLAPAALITHLTYLKSITGSWTAFLTAQFIWYKNPFKFSGYEKYLTDYSIHGFRNSLIDVTVTLFFVALLILASKQLRASYKIYSIILLALPIISGNLMSMTRHVIMIFPSFIIMALLTEKKSLNKILIIFYIAFLILFTTLFVNNYWVG